ncbi:TonB-dependent receptor [Pelodictyon luteolum]|uniref:Ferric siderophore receptor, putative, TonB receptor family n=1 Tax=Chlorobium luteolum (strain DSM 273 / BCRC 81028 / 2530) TaxID=319225 RepID=Q3B687_CHLL3|nr:TonB-dependent receptor [Pelodictyon luteolum]ABB23144.1 ferric siderophore receptor, putative, TonB receptor family [Pelodictyon luteolum DSM 273]
MKSTKTRVRSLARIVATAWCMLAFMVPLTSYGADTGTVKGQVTDRADGEGVYGATVTIGGTTISTATDMDGNFTLRNVPVATQKLSVSIVGYAPASQVVTVAADATATANISLGHTTIMASEVVVGAAMYGQDRLSVPVTANVVTSEQIKEEPNPTLDAVVEGVPGVVVSRAGGTTSSSLQIRGSNVYQGGGIGTRVQALYDGFPINAPESGEIVWQSVNMNAADKVELLKGAAATLYGSGAMGGVVNVYGHLPEKEEILAGSSIGFYDAPPSDDQSAYRESYTPVFWNSYVGYGNKDDKWRYSVLYSHSDDNGYRENTDSYLNDLKIKARYDIDATQYLQLSAFYNATVGGYGRTWPYVAGAGGTVTSTSPELAYDINNPTAYGDDTTLRKNALVGLNYVKMFSDDVSLDTRLYYTHNGTRYEYNPTATAELVTAAAGPIPATYQQPGSFNETYSDRVGAGTKLDWKVSDAHRLLFGVDGNFTNVMSTQVTATTPVAGVLNDIQESNFASFLQDEWKITDRLTSLASVRYDWNGISDDMAGTTPIQNKSVDAVSPRVALNYKAMDDMSFRASWGRSFRAPSLYERFVRDGGFATLTPNPALDKETMTAWEAGVFKQFGERVALDIAGFINNYNDLIESTVITAPSTYQYQNISKARIWGIETNLNIKPVDEVNVNLAYTYMNAKNESYDPATASSSVTNNPDPDWLAYRPEHTASASTTWKATKDLALNVNGRYVSKYKNINMYNNVAGTNYPGDFVVLGVGAKYKVNDNFSTSLVCNNINNTQYEEVMYFRAPGRSYVLGVDFSY